MTNRNKYLDWKLAGLNAFEYFVGRGGRMMQHKVTRSSIEDADRKMSKSNSSDMIPVQVKLGRLKTKCKD